MDDHIRSPSAFYYYGQDELAYLENLVLPPFLLTCLHSERCLRLFHRRPILMRLQLAILPLCFLLFSHHQGFFLFDHQGSLIPPAGTHPDPLASIPNLVNSCTPFRQSLFQNCLCAVHGVCPPLPCSFPPRSFCLCFSFKFRDLWLSILASIVRSYTPSVNSFTYLV